MNMNTEHRFYALISVSMNVVNWINDDMRHAAGFDSLFSYLFEWK